MASQAIQSATRNQLLSAANFVLLNGDGVVAGTGLNQAYISLNVSGYRPRSGEPQEVLYKFENERPFPNFGAGRLGHISYLELLVTVLTRLALDAAGSDTIWTTDETYGANQLIQLVVDMFQDRFLYSAYDPILFVPTGPPLTVEPLQYITSEVAVKPAPDESDKQQDVGGYGKSFARFSLKYVLPLTTTDL